MLQLLLLPLTVVVDKFWKLASDGSVQHTIWNSNGVRRDSVGQVFAARALSAGRHRRPRTRVKRRLGNRSLVRRNGRRRLGHEDQRVAGFRTCPDRCWIGTRFSSVRQRVDWECNRFQCFGFAGSDSVRFQLFCFLFADPNCAAFLEKREWISCWVIFIFSYLKILRIDAYSLSLFNYNNI